MVRYGQISTVTSFHFDASGTCIWFILSDNKWTIFFIGYYTCTFEFQTYDVTLTLLLQGKEVSFVLEAKIYGQLQVSAILSECESWILWSKFLMFSFDC